MIVILSVILWFLVLFFLRPKPSNLREILPSKIKSFSKIQVTFWLGIILILTFYLSTNLSFNKIDDKLLYLFGVNNVEFLNFKWFFQIFSHTFFHLDLFHLLSNLSMLGLLSLYERNVGGKRFFTVFLISATLSSVSVIFYPENLVAVGASGGILGLSAAYFLDHASATTKDYLMGTLGVFAIYFLLQLQTYKGMTQDYKVDEYGHIMGILIAAIYCKIFPRRIDS